MANIGSFGSIRFYVNSNTAVTFSSMTRSHSVSTQDQEVDGGRPLTIFKGPELSKMTFTMILRRDICGNIEYQLKTLISMMDNKVVSTLFIGNKSDGKQWIITGVSESKLTYQKGQIWRTDLSVSMKEHIGWTTETEDESTTAEGYDSDLTE
ncbi:MAG: phage tail protein [Selenomonadaceae bacterium]